MITIGVTGMMGAGKGEVVNFLKTKGFVHYSSREFILNEVRKQGLEETRDSTTLVADNLRREHGPDFIMRSLYEESIKNGKDAVIESIRTFGEIAFLRQIPNSYLLGVNAKPEIRYARILERAGAFDHISYEKFLSDEAREISDDPNRGNLTGCLAQSDIVFENNESLDDLYSQIEIALNDIRSKTV